MQVQYSAIELACPKCGASKAVNVPKSLFEEKQAGHIKIQVPKGAVCQNHVFIVFLDIKGRVIGYESIDVSIGETQKESKEEVRDPITLNDVIDALGFNCVAGLLHAKLFNYPSYLIMNNDGRVNLTLINKIFDDLIPEDYNNLKQLKLIRYDSDTFPASTYFYSLVQNQRRTAFLMNPRKHVIQVPWDSEVEFEKYILNFVLEKKDESEHFKYLAYQIAKFLDDIKYIISILEEKKKISKKELIKELKEKLITSTINKNRIVEIKEFIQRRISTNIANKIKD
jgi:hypothetical protein